MKTLVILLLCMSSSVIAQSTESGRRLPPSLERELRLRKGVAPRVVSFADTISAKTFLSQSLRDTSGVELDSSMVSDSVMVVYDSAVSLTQKAILDSLLVELPEFERTPTGARFNYPNSSLIESRANVIPFDTSILADMEPIVKEPSLYLGALPFQPPLRKPAERSGRLTLILGSFLIPAGEGTMRIASSERTSVFADGSLVHSPRSSAPVPLLWSAGLRSSTYFDGDSLSFDERKPQLLVNGSFSERIRTIDTLAGTSDAAQHFGSLSASFEAGDESVMRLKTNGSLQFYSDAISSSVEELSSAIQIEGAHRFSDDRLVGSIAFQHSGSNSIGDASMSLLSFSARYHSSFPSLFEWSIGISGSSGSDMSGTNGHVLPYLLMRKELSQTLSVGVSYEPSISIISARDLALQNPFYVRSVDDSLALTARRVTKDRSRFTLFGELLSSFDEYIDARLSVASIQHVPYFLHNADSSARSRWMLRSAHTRLLELSVSGAVNTASLDKLSARMTLASEVNSDSNDVLPFVPTLKANLLYTFGRISDNISADLSLRVLSRKDLSMVFFGAEGRYALGERSSLALRFDNITGSASDFWTGSSEEPFAVSLVYKTEF